MSGLPQPPQTHSAQSTWTDRSSSKVDGGNPDHSYLDHLRQILSDEKRPTSERIRSVLRLGVVRFRVETGHLTRIDPAKGTHTIVEVSGSHPDIEPGVSTDLSRTYCRKVIAENEPLAVDNAPRHGWARDPAYQAWKLACYHGAKVVVGERLYGTVCFGDREPRTDPFDESDRAFLEFIAQGIGRVLEQGQREVALREAERQLKRSERLLRGKENVTGVGGWELDVETWESVWTEDVSRIYGLPGGNDLDLTAVVNRIVPTARERFRETVDRAVDTQEPFAMEVPIMTVQEEQHWIEIHGRPRVQEGRVTKIVGTVRDVTGRRREREEIRQSRRESIDRLARVAEHRHFESGNHTRRVGKMSRRLAEALGRPPEWQNRIREAAPLHDLGKIGIPDEILLKPKSLTEEEYEMMKEHTLIGASLLSGGETELVQMAEQIARFHHERWDGTGYPSGLEGEEIPLSARVVAVADAFDAMTHDRPYRKALPPERAFETLEEDAGTQFDPQVSEAALHIREVLVDLV